MSYPFGIPEEDIVENNDIETKEVPEFNGKVLIIGSGGREHALSWKISQSEKVQNIFVAPGNAGTEDEEKVQNLDIDVTNIDKLLEFAKLNDIGLTVVGPEVPLCAGIVDRFREEGLNIFGPTQVAAKIEGSKTFSKELMIDNNIPTAKHGTFNEVDSALKYLEKECSYPIVIKENGLASGKGVVIAETKEEAEKTIRIMLSNKGNKILLEEFLEGEEVSIIVMVDTNGNILPMASSQDHKPIGNGNTGLNTGGMGAVSPAPLVTDELMDEIIDTVIKPAVEGMNDIGKPFSGFLYAGLMITKDGPKNLEYNARFGDPETQPIMMRLESDLVDLLLAGVHGTLDKETMKTIWSSKSAVSVVISSEGYPEEYTKGYIIYGLDNVGDNEKIFHAGTEKINSGDIVTDGGRVLAVTAIDDTIESAQRKAYELVNKIKWKGAYYRTDIGEMAIKKEISMQKK